MAGLTGRPGRELDTDEVLEDVTTPVLLTCIHGHFCWSSPALVGKPCDNRPEIAAPWRRATKADAKRAGLSLDYFERWAA